MKAIRIHEFGGPEVLCLDELPVPSPGAEQVLIQVHAAAVNPVDGKIRAGNFKRFHPQLPAILGRDFSGVIVRAGAAVTGWKEGDEVFGMQDYSRGTYAEYSLALPSEFAAKPTPINHAHAACIGVAGLTAWQALFRCGGMQRGHRVLIHGAGGGVGHFAVQLAVVHGAEVIATASPKDVDFVSALGAAKVIDYKAQRFEDETQDVDIVVDLVGKDIWDRSWQVLKPGGILVSTLGQPEAPAGAHAREVVVECHKGEMAEIAALVVDGRLRIHVDRTFSLANARHAHEYIENEHSRAKTLLAVRE